MKRARQEKGSQELYNERRAAERERARLGMLGAIDKLMTAATTFSACWLLEDDVMAMHVDALDAHANAVYQSLRRLGRGKQ
jgi:hypothetical protein